MKVNTLERNQEDIRSECDEIQYLIEDIQDALPKVRKDRLVLLIDEKLAKAQERLGNIGRLSQ